MWKNERVRLDIDYSDQVYVNYTMSCYDFVIAKIRIDTSYLIALYDCHKLLTNFFALNRSVLKLTDLC